MTVQPWNHAGAEAAIEVHHELKSFYQSAVDNLCDLVQRAVRERGLARIALSGGSTPQKLYEMLADRPLPWQQIHWFWGDERNVAANHGDSNQRMVREALLNRVGAAEANVHPVEVVVSEPEGTARRYEQTLRDHFDDCEFPTWDLALLGLGDDAHTASLFPGTSALQEEQRWFVENRVEKFNAFRYTLTAAAINSAQQSWFLVAGAGKRQALQHVWNGPHRPDDYPAQLIRATRWFVTSDADPRN